jgi:hypothetical protein
MTGVRLGLTYAAAAVLIACVFAMWRAEPGAADGPEQRKSQVRDG